MLISFALTDLGSLLASEAISTLAFLAKSNDTALKISQLLHKYGVITKIIAYTQKNVKGTEKKINSRLNDATFELVSSIISLVKSNYPRAEEIIPYLDFIIRSILLVYYDYR